MAKAKPTTTKARVKKAPVKKRIADVAKPGESAPSVTSKPVIITNRPIIKDPMTNTAPVDIPTVAPASGASVAGKKLQPLSAPVLPDPALTLKAKPIKPIVDNSSAPQISEMIARASKRSVKPATVPEPEPDAAPEPAVAADPTPQIEKPEPQLPKPVKKDTTETPVNEAKTDEQDQAIQDLIDSKKYYVPINAVEKRRAKQFVLLGLLFSILLLLVWGDIALDAGLIEVSGIKPVTHFFSS